jgi:hypothetical protein
MRYMMLVKGNSDYEAGKPPSPALMEAIGALAEKGFRDGSLVEQGGLLPSSAGALIRVRDGKVKVIDGPFAEARELVGGYAILRAGSKVEAIRMGSEFMELHARVLGPSFEGELEVRELFDPPPGTHF